MKLDGLPKDGMPDLGRVGYAFLRRIADAIFFGKYLVDADVYVFVDGG